MLLKSVEQEDDDAQMAIGRAFYVGEGVGEDDAEAFKWFELAANQGNAKAQYYLGECYLKGFGVAENQVRGIELLRHQLLWETQMHSKCFMRMVSNLRKRPKVKE